MLKFLSSKGMINSEQQAFAELIEVLPLKNKT
jgi:hypothetical protein